METPSANSGVGRFLGRALLFLAPLAVLLALDNVILPRGTFTFRAWEALVVATYQDKVPGAFYPNQALHRTEVGELAFGTPLAVKKEVTWITDRRGYRNLPGSEDHAEIVIVGDSMTVGSSLDQGETLPAQLQAATGMRAYGFAPTEMHRAIRTLDRDQSSPPKVIILQQVERFAAQIIPARPGFAKVKKKPPEPIPETWTAAYIDLDYLRKMASIRFARGWLNRRANLFMAALFGVPAGRVFDPLLMASDGRMVTFEGSKANRPKPPAEIEQCAQNVASYAAGLRARGIELIYLPVPNKENIYWDLLANPTPATFLPALAKRVRELGVPCIDLQEAMLNARAARPEKYLYQLDDTHWNAEGVRIAVEELRQTIAGLPARERPQKAGKKLAP